MSIAVRAVRGILWQAGSSWLQVAVNLLGVAIIARWVGPESYGVMGAALLLTGLIRMLSEGALIECVLQRAELEFGHIDASFWTSLVVAGLGAVVLLSLAQPLSALAGAPAAVQVLQVLALLMPLSAASALPLMLIDRALLFRDKAQIGALSTLVSNAVGIAAALSGLGVWSLVCMEVARVMVPHAMAWRLVSWRPGLSCTVNHFRQLRAFNQQVVATYLIGHLDSLLPRALIANLLGPVALGYFLLATRVFDELTRLVTGPLSGITMAIIARLQQDQAAVQRMILGLYRTATLVALPVFAGFIAIAPVAVPMLFGDAWLPAIPAMQVLMISALRTSTAVFNISILRAMGRADLPLWLLGAGVALNTALIPSLVSFGLIGVMVALIARQFLAWPLGALFVRTVSGLTMRQQFRVTLPAASAATVMAVTVGLWSGVAIQTHTVTLTLVSSIALGMLVYTLAIIAFAPGLLTQAAKIARAVLRRDDRGLAATLGEPA